MTSTAAVGDSLAGLQTQVAQSYNRGERVELLLGLDSLPSWEQLSSFQNELVGRGMQLTSPISIVPGPWPATVRLEFLRPDYKGVGFIPIAFVIIGGLGAVSMGSIVGWKLGDAMKKNFIPLLIIGGGILLGALWINTKYQPSRTR